MSAFALLRPSRQKRFVMMKQLEHRLRKLEATMLHASQPVPYIDGIDVAWFRIWMTLAIAGLGNPRPDEPLHQAWSRVVDLVEVRCHSQITIAAIAAARAYFPDNKIDLDKLRDAVNSVPPWLDVFTGLNVARDEFGWPLRDVFNEADPMTPAAALDLFDAWPQ